MSPEDRDDTELRGIAMGAVHEHEASVTNAETESALGSVRSRINAGDPAGDTTSATLTPRTDRRSPWLLFGAAAAVIALVAGGLVTVFGGDDDTIVPATDPPEVAVTAPPATAAPTVPDPTEAPETTVPDPTTSVPESAFERQTISVDAANPPPSIEPEVFARVPIELNPEAAVDSLAWVAIGPDNIVVRQKGTEAMSVVGPQGNVQRIPIEEQISSIVSGPGGVVYGLGDPAVDDGDGSAPGSLRFVAIPFVGEQAGEVVSVAEVELNAYLELPPFFFGHGPDGVIDRGREVGQTVIAYVDESGAPLESVDEFPLPAFAESDDDVIELIDSDVSWKLDIARDPTHTTPYVGRTYPAPTTDGRVIYFERIGADQTPDQDFGPNSLPVIAILNDDGSGSWVSLPEDWDVVASDVWGTVLMRRTDTDLELAFLDDALPPSGESTATTTATTPPTTEPDALDGPDGSGDALAIERTCVSEFDCTQLANTEDGRIVAFDPASTTFRVYDGTGNEMQADVPVDSDLGSLEGGGFVAVGPDDVAYLRVPTSGADGPSNDLLAIPLVGDDAGQVVMSWTGLDGTGDSTLVPRNAGLTFVPCCGPRETRPAEDAPIYRWVDRTGAVIESDAPSFDLNLGDAGNSLTRIDGESNFTPFTLPTVLQYPRDFPTTVATTDGGALAIDFVQLRSGPTTVIVKFGPEWPNNGNVYFQPIDGPSTVGLLEPSGTLVVADGDSFVRRTLDEVATPGWPGRSENAQDGTISAPGLNDHIAEMQPDWADDPGLFALQLKQRVAPNERVTIDYGDAPAPEISITTDGFLDDSVAASRQTVVTERGDDGLLRFVSGTTTYRCQPGRGHQDFSAELCI